VKTFPLDRPPAAGADSEALIQEARRRQRRRYLLTGLAIVVLAAGAAGVAVSHSPPRRPGPSASPSEAWHRAGRLLAPDAAVRSAPYFAWLDLTRLDTSAAVTDVRTGKVVAVVGLPVTDITAVSAAGDDRTFVLAGTLKGTAARFYELRLGPDGRPRPLVLLRVPGLAYANTIAVSASGTKLAIVPPGTGGPAPGVIRVDSLATGAVRVWKAPGGSVTGLSWAGNRFLAFEWRSHAHQEVRLLDTAAAGNSLLAARPILTAPDHTRVGSFTSLDDPLISADGSRLFVTMGWGKDGNPRAEVVEFSARTGQALAVVSPAAGNGPGSWCGALWTDPSGIRAAVTCGGAEGQVDNGHFTQANLHAPHYKAARDSFIGW
jgi:hypothetical protein